MGQSRVVCVFGAVQKHICRWRFFSHEHKRIFVSSLSENKGYRGIVEFLGKRRFATRNEILACLKTKSGGTPSGLLRDLTLCGFIEKYAPYNLHENSSLARYSIPDAYKICPLYAKKWGVMGLW